MDNDGNSTTVIDANGHPQVRDMEEGVSSSKLLRFALVPKQTSSPFFQVVGSGCIDRARVLSLQDNLKVNCSFVGPEFADADEQAEFIRQLVEEDIDGLAIAITKPNHAATLKAIDLATAQGIPVITFDSDDPASDRLAYVGTDNWAFGEALGKVLLQIDPTGGNYALISSNAPNVQEREEGVRFRLRKSGWIEHSESPGNCHDNATLSILQMRNFANNNIKAILPVGGWPMFNQGAQWSLFADDHPDVLTVCADTLPHQMDLLNRNKVNGLVGQIPFQMGVNALDLLFEYKQQGMIHTQDNSGSSVIYGTELHEVITVPLNLPPPDIDHNNIGNLRYLGIVLWALMTMFALACGVWTYIKRRHRVLRASQPFFLLVIVGGILLTIAAIMPLSFLQETVDDIGRESFSSLKEDNEESSTLSVFTCTSPIWFLSIGFTTMFSALFAKTWRINKIFHNPRGFSRLSVTPKDVMWPFVVLLLANVLTLSLMTALVPLEYVRKVNPGTDAWNRVISTYGQCQSTTDRWGGAVPYVIVLALINLGVLVVAIVQAYEARSIQSEFSESHYIAVTMICILQTIVVAGPVLALVHDQPQAEYVVMVCAVFIICAITLGCIFGPKILKANTFDSRQSQHTSSTGNSRRVSLVGSVQVFRAHGSSSSSSNIKVGSGGTTSTGSSNIIKDGSGGTTSTDPNEGTARTIAGVSGDNVDNSEDSDDVEGLRFWRSQISEIEH